MCKAGLVRLAGYYKARPVRLAGYYKAGLVRLAGYYKAGLVRLAGYYRWILQDRAAPLRCRNMQLRQFFNYRFAKPRGTDSDPSMFNILHSLGKLDILDQGKFACANTQVHDIHVKLN